MHSNPVLCCAALFVKHLTGRHALLERFGKVEFAAIEGLVCDHVGPLPYLRNASMTHAVQHPGLDFVPHLLQARLSTNAERATAAYRGEGSVAAATHERAHET